MCKGRELECPGLIPSRGESALFRAHTHTRPGGHGFMTSGRQEPENTLLSLSSSLSPPNPDEVN